MTRMYENSCDVLVQGSTPGPGFDNRVPDLALELHAFCGSPHL